MILKGYKALQLVAICLATYLLLRALFRHSIETPWPGQLPYISHNLIDSNTLNHIQNETLGFEHIFAIGLPERTDKRDFLTLASSLSGFKLEWLDGVKPDNLQQKAMPKGLNISSTVPTIVACWRAHMNALVRVVENSYSTALIMEDDADWDISLKAQLTEFAHGLHSIQDNKKVSREAPYGTNWDVLWIGGCMSGPSSNETHFYAIPNDPTVPSVEQRQGAAGIPESWKQTFSENSTRYIYQAATGCCLYGYAVTGQGARKILAALSVDHIEIPVDNALSDLCGGTAGRQSISCYAPSPNLIGTFRRAGPSSQDSDIESYDPSHFHDERSWNMVFSTKRNIHRLAADEKTLHSQWRDAPEKWQQAEINLGDFTYPRGLLVDI